MYSGVMGHRSPALREVAESHRDHFAEVNVEVWFVVSRKRWKPECVNVGTLNNSAALDPTAPKRGALHLRHVRYGTYAGHGDETVGTRLCAQFARRMQYRDSVKRCPARLTRVAVRCGKDVAMPRRV